jgi:hypothetical protein
LGGTVAEAWTGAPALEEFPEFKLQLDEVAAVVASTAEDPAVETGWCAILGSNQ